MRQHLSRRSQQLLYIVFAMSIFSIISMSYKYATAKDADQSVAKLDCTAGNNEQEPRNEPCQELEFERAIQFSSLKP